MRRGANSSIWIINQLKHSQVTTVNHPTHQEPRPRVPQVDANSGSRLTSALTERSRYAVVALGSRRGPGLDIRRQPEILVTATVIDHVSPARQGVIIGRGRRPLRGRHVVRRGNIRKVKEDSSYIGVKEQ
ncbi:hypothetical protein WN944_024472 [Citrus x changshan-huyou]|uniref:Uncharacterized protein n=1 Tax=Citrus x changshan-huyou TaxID=2935761 RepID=A0AAP0LUA9_9ROSI